ncbi:hypothetical protein LCGC14_1711120 [marine sediment metagenome]|uniref:HTH luxR-type domain-containing protein n=1 Tax=marine sediment metagenome TaxID=412755 RepID=A0A0F9KF58_9ZZZZ
MNKQKVSKEICQHTFCITCVNAFEQDTGDKVFHITPSQYRVIAYLMKGYSNKQIGAALGLSVLTIKNHFSAIRVTTGQTRVGIAILFITGRIIVRSRAAKALSSIESIGT